MHHSTQSAKVAAEQTDRPYYTAFLLSILCALALSVESYLNIVGLSLCKTEACEVVADYLKISESLLIAIGAAFFWLIALLLFFVKSYPRPLKPIIISFFAVALSFDGGILGFQFFTIQQKCILCISVAAALIIIFSLYCTSQKTFLILICCLLGWATAFGTNSVIKMVVPRDAYTSMAFYSKAATDNSLPRPAQLTLIFSMNCPHCLDVVEYLKEYQYIDDFSWRLATIDQDNQSLAKISQFLQDVNKDKNPFTLLGELKKQPVTHSAKISASLKQLGEKSITFLANVNANTIPVLFVEQNSSKELITSASSIIDFFNNYKKPTP